MLDHALHPMSFSILLTVKQRGVYFPVPHPWPEWLRLHVEATQATPTNRKCHQNVVLKKHCMQKPCHVRAASSQRSKELQNRALCSRQQRCGNAAKALCNRLERHAAAFILNMLKTNAVAWRLHIVFDNVVATLWGLLERCRLRARI